ncbi:MAG: beta-ketoacyl-ACP synthase II [Pseudomonadota bacterium]|nr:beta-ketoacyl-ACP synthase II [Pseudomonadota bacterium]
MTKRRVVVTGLGMLSPLGLNVEDSWRAIVAGQSGVGPITAFDATEYPARICAAVKNFDPSPYLDNREVRRNDLFVQFGIAAAQQALVDSNLVVTEQNADRIGVIIGSGIGGLPAIQGGQDTVRDFGPKKISPFFIPSVIINMVAGCVSIKYGLKGPNFSVVSACTTGNHNIGTAARMIVYGDADVMLTGGTEMATTTLGIGGFSALRALSTRNDEPTKASRPWDKDRDGFVLGEGAGVIVLEEYEHAKARGAKIYAELAGFGMSADAFHITSPDENGAGFVASMRNTLHDAGMNPEEIDYINAHGTSTPTGDVIECSAVKQTFGEHAQKLCVSSTKSMTGHLLGAAGAVEAIFSILAIRDQVAPPTINLDNPDVGCDLNFVAHTAQQREINAVLSNSFGFGGTNGSLIFKRI